MERESLGREGRFVFGGGVYTILVGVQGKETDEADVDD